MKKIVVLFTLIMVFSCSSVKPKKASEQKEIMGVQPKIVSLYNGNSGDMSAFEVGNFIVKNTSELQRFSRLYKISETAVDFTKEIIIVAVDELHNTGGYGVRITAIQNEGGKTVVSVQKTTPRPTDMVTMAFAQPFHIIKTQKTDKEIIFKEL